MEDSASLEKFDVAGGGKAVEDCSTVDIEGLSAFMEEGRRTATLVTVTRLPDRREDEGSEAIEEGEVDGSDELAVAIGLAL